jgi:enoyl-CoA hydratase
MSAPAAQPAGPEAVIRVEGRAGRITLNRPRALNALTLGMVRDIWAALLVWRDDPAVDLVILDGAGDRGLCAGGDVRSLYDARTEGSELARTFWREEYRLNALIHRYPKPYVAFMDGIVMGGGIGLSAHAQGGTRIVTERSRIAFPETTIGLIPDVGGTWLLSRAPAGTGAYLALLGAQMTAADAIYAGFADHFVPSTRLGDLAGALASSDALPGAVIASFAADAGTSELATTLRGEVSAHFRHAKVEEIGASLSAEDSDFARKALEGLASRSPLAMKATLEALDRARRLSNLEEALAMEFRLCTHLYEGGEFIEGVRALIVDKDRKPRWTPPDLGAVTPTLVEALFAPVDGDRGPFSGHA